MHTYKYIHAYVKHTRPNKKTHEKSRIYVQIFAHTHMKAHAHAHAHPQMKSKRALARRHP